MTKLLVGICRRYEELPSTNGGANVDLVTLVNDLPTCILHGAMNKVSAFGHWRCIHAAPCRAGVMQIS